MNNVNIGYGKVTFTGVSASYLAAIVSPTFNRNGVSKVFKKIGRPTIYPASIRPEINGKLYAESYTLPDNTIILFQAQNSRAGVRMSESAVFIRVRSSGPRLSLFARTPRSNESSLNENFVMFIGKGDILSLPELASAGISPPRQYLQAFLNEEEREECFIIEQQELATTTKKPTIATIEIAGKEAQVVAIPSAPTRKIRLKK